MLYTRWISLIFISGDVITLNALDVIESNIMRGSRTCLNWELSEMIAAVHQGVITVEIKHDQNASEASDEDPMDAFSRGFITHNDGSFSCVVKTQRRRSNKIYKTELTKTRYNNQVLGKYQVDPQRAGLTLIAKLTWSNLGLKGVLNKRK